MFKHHKPRPERRLVPVSQETVLQDLAIEQKNSQLLNLDAQDFDSEPIARLFIPSWIPTSVHGNWIPDESA